MNCIKDQCQTMESRLRARLSRTRCLRKRNRDKQIESVTKGRCIDKCLAIQRHSQGSLREWADLHRRRNRGVASVLSKGTARTLRQVSQGHGRRSFTREAGYQTSNPRKLSHATLHLPNNSRKKKKNVPSICMDHIKRLKIRPDINDIQRVHIQKLN